MLYVLVSVLILLIVHIVFWLITPNFEHYFLEFHVHTFLHLTWTFNAFWWLIPQIFTIYVFVHYTILELLVPTSCILVFLVITLGLFVVILSEVSCVFFDFCFKGLLHYLVYSYDNDMWNIIWSLFFSYFLFYYVTLIIIIFAFFVFFYFFFSKIFNIKLILIRLVWRHHDFFCVCDLITNDKFLFLFKVGNFMFCVIWRGH